MKKNSLKKDTRQWGNTAIETGNGRAVCPHCPGQDIRYYSVEDSHQAGLELTALSAEQIKKLFYGQCPSCKTVYYLNTAEVEYEDDYFTVEYKQQYGKSYEDDHKSISALNRARVKWLKPFLHRLTRDSENPGMLHTLDIGCALGYFLEELQKESYTGLEGIDISRYAIKNAVKAPGITCKRSDFFSWYENWKKKGEKQYDLITAFFVLEHFPQQNRFFECISEMVKPGGYFYFAVPSTNGPLFDFQREQWFVSHPRDHFADYSPDSLRRILPGYRFEPAAFRVPSFHPERMKGPLGMLSSGNEIGERLYQMYSHFNSYGDTVECLARKNKE